MDNLDLKSMPPYKVRELIREGKITSNTSGMSLGYAQANLVILPKEYAYDFLLFAIRNPKSCPILEVSDKGSRTLKYIAKNADIATDIPKYRIYKDGVLEKEVSDVGGIWQDDFVSFLIGCSFSFESSLIDAGVPVRHIDEKKNVPMYLTNIDTVPAGIFSGKMVVSMRPVKAKDVTKAVIATAGMSKVHGTPVWIGKPEYLGIKDINKPDFGDSVTINDDEVPVFWCCGVTPQSVVMASKPKIAITHSPGHMFITDILNNELKD